MGEPFRHRLRVRYHECDPQAIVFNANYLDVDENNATNIDVREGTSRTDSHVGLQEAFLEKHVCDLSANYDFLSVTAGIQPFVSDFRGLVFTDNNLGGKATSIAPTDEVVIGSGIDTFTGSPYFALGSTSKVVKAKKQ